MEHYEAAEGARRSSRTTASSLPSVAIAVGLAALIGAAIVVGQVF